MNRIRFLVCALILLALVAGVVLRRDALPDERTALQELVPGGVFLEKQGSPPRYSSVSGVVAFNTHDIVPAIRGYAGPIKTLVALDRNGKIVGLKLLEHRETKNYVHFMETPEYLSRFVGKSVHDPFQIDRDLDGISRATVSVEALGKTVREASRSVAVQVYGIEVKGAGGQAVSSRAWLLYLALFSLALAGYFATRKSRRFLRGRDVALLASIVITGVFLSSPFSILHVYNLVLYGPSREALWLLLVGSTLGSLLFAGRFYCGWLCPFGALSEFIGRVPLRKLEVPAEMDRRWRKLKYLFFGLATCTALGYGRSDFGNYEPYVTLFSFSGSALMWLLLTVTLLANLKVERFWCRYLCPVAALTGIVSMPASGYPSTGNCPMANSPYPHQSECIRCNRCYQEMKPSA